MAYTDTEDTGKEKLGDIKKIEDAKELVLKRFNVSEKYTQPFFTRFQEYYRLYRSELESGRLPWRSNLFISKTFEIVETVAPRIAQAQRTFTTLPVEGMDTGNAEAYSDLLKFQFSKTNMEDILEELVKEALIYGTAVCKTSWKDGMPNPEVVDIFDFFPDPKARNAEEMKYGIHRLERDIEDLEQNPNYKKEVIERLKSQKSSDLPSNQERMYREGLIGVNSSDTSRQRYRVLEYWGDFRGEPYIIVLAGNEVLRCDKNPYTNWNPFTVIRDTIVPHEFYGIGEIEPVVSLQNELNDIRNQRMDNVKINLNRMWKIVAGGVQFEDELVSRPGGIIHLTRPDGLIPSDTQPLPAEAFTEESIIKSDMERITGANSPLSGALTSPMGGTQGGVINRTATAWQGAINQADKRFNSKIQQLKRGLIKIGRKFLELSQQFMTQEQLIRVVGKNGEAALIPIQPEDIKSNFDLDVEIDYMDEMQKMSQDIQLLQTMVNVPNFNVAKLGADILQHSGRKNVEEYILPPEPVAPEQPNVNYQLKGELMPDAVAQILDKKENIKTHPKEVASRMRAASMEEAAKAAEVQEALTTQTV